MRGSISKQLHACQKIVLQMKMLYRHALTDSSDLYRYFMIAQRIMIELRKEEWRAADRRRGVSAEEPGSEEGGSQRHCTVKVICT